jgi:uncharacterized glyoxalase superfamily protein PhnB
MPWVVPYLTVTDPEASLRFYEKAFGFERRAESCVNGPDGKMMHGEMRFHDSVIMLGPECQQDRTPANSGVSSPLSLYIYCDDVDALKKRAQSAGAQVVCEPVDMFWGDRISTLSDPDGHRWTFATNVADFDPEKAAAAMSGAGA